MSKSLTKKEQAWVTRVQKALDACPSPDKIGFFVTGDRNVNLYDLRMDDDVYNVMDTKPADFGPACEILGCMFDEDIKFPSPVNGTAG